MDENAFNAGGPADEEVDLYGEFWLPRICTPNVAGFFSPSARGGPETLRAEADWRGDRVAQYR